MSPTAYQLLEEGQTLPELKPPKLPHEWLRPFDVASRMAALAARMWMTLAADAVPSDAPTADAKAPTARPGNADDR